MTSGPIYKVPFKRRKEQKTNYKKRLATLKSEKHRFVARLSNTRFFAQIVEYSKDGDKTLLFADSRELKALGWNYSLKNTSAVYLTALLLSKKALKNKIPEVIFDLGAKNYKSRSKIFAALKGIVDSGLPCPYDEKAFPDEDRINGKVLSAHTKKEMNKEFNLIKEKILKM
ncbi:MAG: 50S ribosomal protein L18 [Candidatus ainarchaeum sp.]|nr:50S ribosomal protein L18 [Candidatus ainarchaeum sp.]